MKSGGYTSSPISVRCWILRSDERNVQKIRFYLFWSRSKSLSLILSTVSPCKNSERPLTRLPARLISKGGIARTGPSVLYIPICRPKIAIWSWKKSKTAWEKSSDTPFPRMPLLKHIYTRKTWEKNRFAIPWIPLTHCRTTRNGPPLTWLRRRQRELSISPEASWESFFFLRLLF